MPHTKERLSKLTNKQLDSLYEKQIGYRPIEECEVDREDVIETLIGHQLEEWNADYYAKYKVGSHSPKKTYQTLQVLKRAGFPFVDTSWGNDETDSLEVEINGKTYRVWIGDPANEDYSKNSLWLKDESSECCDTELVPECSDFAPIIAHLKTLGYVAPVVQTKPEQPQDIQAINRELIEALVKALPYIAYTIEVKGDSNEEDDNFFQSVQSLINKAKGI